MPVLSQNQAEGSTHNRNPSNRVQPKKTAQGELKNGLRTALPSAVNRRGAFKSVTPFSCLIDRPCRADSLCAYCPRSHALRFAEISLERPAAGTFSVSPGKPDTGRNTGEQGRSRLRQRSCCPIAELSSSIGASELFISISLSCSSSLKISQRSNSDSSGDS